MSIEEWFARQGEDLDAVYARFSNAGLIDRVRLQRYICKRGCVVATVFRVGARTLCAVRDYKYSPGLNTARSVAAARQKNTLDGDRHWPSHVFDVDSLATWPDGTGMDMNCSHFRGTVHARDVLERVKGARPGRQIAPHRLGVS